MLANAVRISDAKFGNLLMYDGSAFRMAAMHGGTAGMGMRCGDVNR